ncbi:MAG: hypothetical protein ABR538_02125 [Candidatus Binatia bacterium]
MSLIRRSLGSAFQATGRFVLVIAAAVAAGVAFNWAILLGATGIPALEAASLSGGAGWLSQGALSLVLGVAFPVVWLLAAQPMAIMSSARHVYRRHKEDVFSGIAAVLRAELGEADDARAAQWSERYEGLKKSLEEKQPALIRPVVRLAIRFSPLPEVEEKVRNGSGPVPVRVARAIVDQLEEHLAEGASLWLWIVFALNVAVIGSVVMLGG